MKQQEVFKKTGGILKELLEQYQYLETSGEHLNDLELELFVANAHFLADHAEILRKLNMQAPAALPAHTPKAPMPKVEPQRLEAPKPVVEAPRQEQKFFEPVVQQVPVPPKPVEIPRTEQSKPVELEITSVSETNEEPAGIIDLESDHTEESFSYIRQEPETIRHELTLDESIDWENGDDEETELPDDNDEEIIELPEDPELNRKPFYPSEPPAEQTPEPVAEPAPVSTPAPQWDPPVSPSAEPKIETAPVQPAMASNDEVMTLNQRISAQMGKQPDNNSSLQPIRDLKSAINLNDKLLYVKDLFNGYSLAYSEAIEILNRFNNLDEADRFLKANYVAKNKWEEKQATADKFYSILKRRFA